LTNDQRNAIIAYAEATTEKNKLNSKMKAHVDALFAEAEAKVVAEAEAKARAEAEAKAQAAAKAEVKSEP